MILKLNDGGQFEGQTAQEIAGKIWQSSKFDQSQTIDEFMTSFAERSKVYDEKLIDASSAEAFVKSLIESNLAALTD